MATRGIKTRVAALPIPRTLAPMTALMMNSGKSIVLILIKGIKWYYMSRYHPKTCCLPHGGPPSTPNPPTGSDCPRYEWYWGPQGCCVPYHPNPSPPHCRQGWQWNAESYKCTPISTPPSPSNPQPSYRHHDNVNGWKKRSQKFGVNRL
jgi:hypothetical protein